MRPHKGCMWRIGRRGAPCIRLYHEVGPVCADELVFASRLNLWRLNLSKRLTLAGWGRRGRMVLFKLPNSGKQSICRVDATALRQSSPLSPDCCVRNCNARLVPHVI